MTKFQQIQQDSGLPIQQSSAPIRNLSHGQKLFLFLLRVSLGWLLFWAGITKVLNPSWSAGGYLNGAKTFSGFYHWLASPGILPLINFLNAWGLTLIGACLVLGLFVRLSSIFGALLMLLYYLPILDFPYPDKNSFLVDQHIIFAIAMFFFAAVRAGRIWGLDEKCARLGICSKFPRLRSLFG